jgi:hypothetical protein
MWFAGDRAPDDSEAMLIRALEEAFSGGRGAVFVGVGRG